MTDHAKPFMVIEVPLTEPQWQQLNELQLYFDLPAPEVFLTLLRAVAREFAPEIAARNHKRDGAKVTWPCATCDGRGCPVCGPQQAVGTCAKCGDPTAQHVCPGCFGAE